MALSNGHSMGPCSDTRMSGWFFGVCFSSSFRYLGWRSRMLSTDVKLYPNTFNNPVFFFFPIPIPILIIVHILTFVLLLHFSLNTSSVHYLRIQAPNQWFDPSEWMAKEEFKEMRTWLIHTQIYITSII